MLSFCAMRLVNDEQIALQDALTSVRVLDNLNRPGCERALACHTFCADVKRWCAFAAWRDMGRQFPFPAPNHYIVRCEDSHLPPAGCGDPGDQSGHSCLAEANIVRQKDSATCRLAVA